MNNQKFSILILIISVSLFGCVKYSFKGALPSYLKTVYIQSFDDKSTSPIPEATEIITRTVIEKFLEDNTLQIVNKEKGADLVITGILTDVSSRFETVGDDETVTQRKLVVKISVECLNTKLDKPLWKGSLSEYGFYDDEEGDLETAYEDAVELLAESILDKTIAAW